MDSKQDPSNQDGAQLQLRPHGKRESETLKDMGICNVKKTHRHYTQNLYMTYLQIFCS
jgi:hypothetical protein